MLTNCFFSLSFSILFVMNYFAPTNKDKKSFFIRIYVWLSYMYLEYDLPAWHMMTLTSLGSRIPVLWLAPPSASLATNIVWGSSCNKRFLNLTSSKDILFTNQIRIRYYINWNLFGFFQTRRKKSLRVLWGNFWQHLLFIKNWDM